MSSIRNDFKLRLRADRCQNKFIVGSAPQIVVDCHEVIQIQKQQREVPDFVSAMLAVPFLRLRFSTQTQVTRDNFQTASKPK
jgi:hypothetical protein